MESVASTIVAGNPVDTGLLTLDNGEPRVSSLVLAQGTATEHRAILQLIQSYRREFEKFGKLTFEMHVVNREQLGGRQPKFFLLNEAQSTLLITFMRNNEVVVDFKVRLVQAFQALRLAVQSPNPRKLSRLDLITIAMDAEKERLTLACENEVLRPKAAFHDQVHASEDTITVAEFAKACGTGLTRMFRFLRKAGYLIKGNNLPYQTRLEQGLFKVVEEAFQDKHGRDRLFMKVLITGKGQTVIGKAFRAQGENPKLPGMGV